MTSSERMPQGADFASLDRVNFVSSGFSGTNLEHLSLHNIRVTLQAIRLNSPVSKVELAEITGLTPPSIANITRKLLADGLIIETGRRRGERGQPAVEIAINADGAFSLGVNIDRDRLTLVALDFLGRVRARMSEEIAFPMPHEVADFFRRNMDIIRASGEVVMERITGVGVAMPDDFGLVNLPHRPSNFGIWESIDIRTLFTPYDFDVSLQNNASAAAMGELQFGHGRAVQNLFYILIGLGLGSGLVIDGQAVRGGTGRSGEIGFLPIGKARRNSETLQEYVSLSGLFRHLSAAGFPHLQLHDLEHLEGASAAAALVWVEKAADLLCDPLLVINAAIDPEAIFIGGRLPARLVDLLCDRLAVIIRRRGGALPTRAPIRRAAMAGDAAAMGAAILPFSNRFFPSRFGQDTTAM